MPGIDIDSVRGIRNQKFAWQMFEQLIISASIMKFKFWYGLKKGIKTF
jgi:hypothetical protein